MISQRGEGLALLAGGRKTLTRVEFHGEGDADDVLLGLIEQWKERGRPTGDDLRIQMTFRDGVDFFEVMWAS